MTFQPQIDKVSRVLGELQIQQKYAQKEIRLDEAGNNLEQSRAEGSKLRGDGDDDEGNEDGAYNLMGDNLEGLADGDRQA